jgi:hypothetical protein
VGFVRALILLYSDLASLSTAQPRYAERIEVLRELPTEVDVRDLHIPGCPDTVALRFQAARVERVATSATRA